MKKRQLDFTEVEISHFSSFCKLVCLLMVSLAMSGNVYAQAESVLKLESQLRFPGSFTTDVWGYVNAADGTEYAVVGSDGIRLIDVSDPAKPVQVAHITEAPGFDVKVWKHYVYAVNGSGSRDNGVIVNIQNPKAPEIAGTFRTAHNIYIDSNGYLYLEVPGLKIYDLNSDPTNPIFVWSDNDGDGHDAIVYGDTLVDFHGVGGTNIYDISDPRQPQLISAIRDPGIAYSHSGWFDKTGRYLFICDEGARSVADDFTIWDMARLDNPMKVGGFLDPDATVHNLYIIDDFAYVSYYSAGFRIFDVSNPKTPVLAAEYDTSPNNGLGAFGVYPFSPSGTIYLSDSENGLHLFTFSDLASDSNFVSGPEPERFTLHDNYPNPFNPATTIRVELPADAQIELTIYNILGQPVRKLFSGFKRAGFHPFDWDAKDDSGRQLPAGVYIYQVTAANFSEAKRMVLLR